MVRFFNKRRHLRLEKCGRAKTKSIIMTLEFPPDVANKIVGMLQPTERPLAVLCVSRADAGARHMYGRLRAGSVTDGERVLLELKNGGCDFWSTPYLRSKEDVKYLVHMALALGFGFRGEADRARWQAGEDFELYRNAVRALR
jgi:hypothetical protein